MPNPTSANLESLFPNLVTAGYQCTSDTTPSYNCIAWAAGDDGRWWEPTPIPGYYWPTAEYSSNATKAVVEMFIARGYAICADASLEMGTKKVAIFGDMLGYTHAARQLPNGKWTSKIGGLEDIEHATLEGLCGDEYGTVQFILSK